MPTAIIFLGPISFVFDSDYIVVVKFTFSKEPGITFGFELVSRLLNVRPEEAKAGKESLGLGRKLRTNGTVHRIQFKF